jgi:hypothetical protein
LALRTECNNTLLEVIACSLSETVLPAIIGGRRDAGE